MPTLLQPVHKVFIIHDVLERFLGSRAKIGLENANHKAIGVSGHGCEAQTLFGIPLMLDFRRSLLLGLTAGSLVLGLATGPEKSENLAQPDRRSAYWQAAFREVLQSEEGTPTPPRTTIRARIKRGNPKLRQLALTFDDGPHPGYTERLLHVLHESNVKATFFVVGKMVEDHPELVKEIAAEGHLVANHTFSHICMTNFTPTEMMTEWTATNEIIQEITGKTPKFCRPPGGKYDQRVIQSAQACGLTTVLWTSDPGDYDCPGTEFIYRKLKRDMQNGGIILLHSGVDQTLDLLPRLIRESKQAGYQFVTVAQLSSN